MCYSNRVSSGDQKGSVVVQQRWLVLRTPPVITTVRRTPSIRGTGEAGGAGLTKRCVCSPSTHPGSFKCRHHRAEYLWGGRLVNKR
ncbi:hypothetical protein SLE2022_266900 [Rubroshorea leprosula]